MSELPGTASDLQGQSQRDSDSRMQTDNEQPSGSAASNHGEVVVEAVDQLDPAEKTEGHVKSLAEVLFADEANE